MSSASSAVTYTSVYTDSEPGRVFWGVDEEMSDGGSPRVVASLPPDFVPVHVYPEFLVPSDAEEEETSDDKEEEHLALADPSVVPVVDPVPSAGDIEAVEAEEPAPAHGSPRTRVPFFSNTSS
ncbi:hypothetical protein Tco_1049597 [Tanacetum coccineum]